MKHQFYLWILFGFFLLNSCNQAKEKVFPSYAKSNDFQLANPIIKSESVLFEKEQNVSATLGIEGATIHYTLDDAEPTSQSQKIETAISIQQSSTLKVKAFHPDFSPSETVRTTFVKLGEPLAISEVKINREPHKNYPGSGVAGLTDRQKGSTNFRTKYWMGFDGGALETTIYFNDKTVVQSINASLLSDPGSWIFLPESIEVLGSKNGVNFKTLAKKSISPAKENTPLSLEFKEVSFSSTKIKALKIIINQMEGIPDWHPGKGTPPWLFIDEIIIE